MVISWFLILIFLIAILLEMVFLGRYVSISQNMFHNKTFASFGLGAAIYFGLTLIVLFPFVWLKLPLIWYAIIIFVKDFFTFVFLISRKERFGKWKVNYYELAVMLIVGLSLPIFYHYGMENWFNMKEIPLPLNDQKGSNIFQTYDIWTRALIELTRGEVLNVKNVLINPIVSIIFVAAIGGIYSEFTRGERKIDLLIIILLTFGIILLFNMKLHLDHLIFIPFSIMMAHYGYNIIMFSRRRYGTLFGILSLVIWTVNPLTFWLIFTIGFGISLLYVILRKRRPSIFITQIMSPILIIVALRFVDFSSILAFVLSSFAIALYLSIFFFGRIDWVERTNIIFGYLGYIWLIIASSVVVVTGITLGFIEDNFYNVFWSGNAIASTYESWSYDIILNIFYYTTLVLLIIYSVYVYVIKGKVIKGRVIIFTIAIIFFTIFNPFSQLIFNYAEAIEQYEYIKLSVGPLIVILIGTEISNTVKENRHNKTTS